MAASETAQRARIDDIRAVFNRNHGIYSAALGTLVSNCVANDNGGEWSLHFGTGAYVQCHWHKPQTGNQCRHQHGT